MQTMPYHIQARINEYVNILHIVEQRDKFEKVLASIKMAGISETEEMPDLLDVCTGLTYDESTPGWSQRVSEVRYNAGEISNFVMP